MWKRRTKKNKKKDEAPYSAHFHSASAFALIAETFVDAGPRVLLCLGSSRSYFRMTTPGGQGPEVWCENEPEGIGSPRVCFLLEDGLMSMCSHLEFLESSDKAHDLTLEYAGTDHIACRVESVNASYAFRIPFVRLIPPAEFDHACMRLNQEFTHAVKMSTKTYARTVRCVLLVRSEEEEKEDIIKMKCVDSVAFKKTPSTLATMKFIKTVSEKWDDPGVVFNIDSHRLGISERVRMFSNVDCLLRLCVRTKACVVECKINTRCKSDGLFIAFPIHKAQEEDAHECTLVA